NLRGVKEAGVLFALPTYAFVSSIFVLIGVGLTRCAASGCPQAVAPHPIVAGAGAGAGLPAFRPGAPRGGGPAGVGAVPGPGATVFRRPHGRNAAATLTVLGVIAITMFVGVSWLAVQMHALPTESGTPSVLSEIARATFPSSSAFGFMYWVVQVLTLAVLVLA